MIYTWMKKASIFKWKPDPKEFHWNVLYSSLFDILWNMLYWCSIKSIALKINGQTFKYEIDIQALKDTSWMKPCHLARFFLYLKYQTTTVVVC